MTDHVCKTCKRVFKSGSALRLHKTTHSSDRPHKCTVCGKAFKRKGTLVDHVKIHENIAHLSCEVCNKTFLRVGNLNRHRLIHAGVKSHKCNQCGMAFTQSGTLSNHMLTHLGENKPYICTLCNRKFTRRANARDHVTKVHSIVTDVFDYIKKAAMEVSTETSTETSTQKLDNGQVATCTTQKTVISRDLVTYVSQIATETACVTVISQQHPMVTVATVSQRCPRVTASAADQPYPWATASAISHQYPWITSSAVSQEPAPLVTHFHQEPDELNTDDLLDMMEEYSTATIETTFGSLNFNPLDSFKDIPI